MGNKIIKLITGEIIIGTIDSILSQIRLIKPFDVFDGKISPYCIYHLGTAPKAVKLEQKNIIWMMPLEDFPEIESVYLKAISDS